MKKITLISYHAWFSKRKAGFYWLAKAFHSMGYHVVFITAPYSLFSIIYRDHRNNYILKTNVPVDVQEGLETYVYFSLIHPENYKKIDKLCDLFFINKFFSIIDCALTPFFKRYGKKIPDSMLEIIKGSDYIIFESTPALMLFDTIKKMNPHSTMVYRMSDDMELYKQHPVVLDYQQEVLHKFDLVSVISESVYQKFSSCENIRVQSHGIQLDVFSFNTPKPGEYEKYQKNIIFIGCSHFDWDFLRIASMLFPDFGFHIIGPLPKKISSNNVIYYGEIPFDMTIPFIAHADIGLMTRQLDPHLTSLKLMQYTWNKLPIIIPDYIGKKFPHFFSYKNNESSIKKAIEQALIYDRRSIDTSWIPSWDNVAQKILQDADQNKENRS